MILSWAEGPYNHMGIENGPNFIMKSAVKNTGQCIYMWSVNVLEGGMNALCRKLSI